MVKILTQVVFCIFFTSGYALAQEEPADKEPNPGARIAAYGQVGRVIVDGQTVYISKGLTDIVMKDGEVDLENNDKIKCEHRRRTGSHIVLRICRTVEELKEMQELNEKEFGQFLWQRKTLCASGGRTRAARTFPGDNSSLCGR